MKVDCVCDEVTAESLTDICIPQFPHRRTMSYYTAAGTSRATWARENILPGPLWEEKF